jgi:hypothetical protein
MQYRRAIFFGFVSVPPVEEVLTVTLIPVVLLPVVAPVFN